MNIANFVSFVIANGMCSFVGASLMKKKFPQYRLRNLTIVFFIGYIVFFWMASKL